MSEDVMLKPCPYCGVVPEEYEESYGDWRIYCANDDCLVQVDVTDPSKEEAITAWNTRAGEHAAHERGRAEGAEAGYGGVGIRKTISRRNKSPLSI